jgi:hypothetical protein
VRACANTLANFSATGSRILGLRRHVGDVIPAR